MGGLAPTTLPDGRATQVSLLPLALDDERLPLRRDPPPLGADNDELLARPGYAPAQVQALRRAGVLVLGG
jgi:crotonobetainyl-CoA:carnitine CoA-transferase CaiB-like acyl-CoA transferase